MMADDRSAKVEIGTKKKDWALRVLHSEETLDHYANSLDDASKTSLKTKRDQF